MTAPMAPSGTAWRRLCDAACRHGDDAWRLGDGGDFLLDLLSELRHPRTPGVAAVSDEQLDAALDRLGVAPAVAS